METPKAKEDNLAERQNNLRQSNDVRMSPDVGMPASPHLASRRHFSRDSKFPLHIAGTFGVRLFMIANSVFAGIITARWLGVEGLGQLAVINVSVSTVVQLASLGLPSANTYFLAQDRRRFRTAATNSFVFALIIGTLLGVGLSGLASLKPSWFAFVSVDLIRVAAISIPFQLLTLIALNMFLAIGNVRDFNLLDVAGQSFVLINALVVLVILRSGLATLVTLNTITSIVVAAVVTILVVVAGRKVADASWRSDVSFFLRTVSYGVKFHISILAGALIFRADLLVVNHFRGSAEAGVYSVASQVGIMLMLLPGVIATLLFPRVTAEQDTRGETTCQVTRYTAFVMFVWCLAAVPLSFLLPFLYGPAFAEAIVQLWILLPGVYLIGLESVLVQHFNAMGLPRSIPLFWLATLGMNIGFVFALVPRFGARGAAVASTISYAMIFALVTLRFLLTSRQSLSATFFLRGVEFRRLVDFRNALRPLARGVQG